MNSHIRKLEESPLKELLKPENDKSVPFQKTILDELEDLEPLTTLDGMVPYAF